MVAPATAAPPPPADLEVEGGEDTWHAKRSFRLIWRIPPLASGSPVVAVHHRLREPGGGIVATGRIGWAAVSLEGLTVPDLPGAYTAEIWLEDAAGSQGAAATAKLRFDDTRPAAVQPQLAATWVGRAAFPLSVRLSEPVDPPPLSGIRGYAVSVASPPGKSPCAGPDRCAEEEVDVLGSDRSYEIADLPEGTAYVDAVAVSGSGVRSADVGRTVLHVDKTNPVTTLHGLVPGWVDDPVELVARAADSAAGMEPQRGGVTPFTAIEIDGGTPAIETGPAVAATAIGDGVHRIAYYARDAAGNADDGGYSNGVRNREPRSALVRIDGTPPAVAFANAQDPRRPELITAKVADSLSGPASSRGWIGIRRAGSGDPFRPLPSVPAPSGELRALWDSDHDPVGVYEFRAVGYDVAGNGTETTRRVDGTSMTLANPLKAPTSLRTAFGGDALVGHRCRRSVGGPRCQRQTTSDPAARPSERTVPHGRSVLVGGRLALGRGAPLAGQAVQVVERFAAGSGVEERTHLVSTGNDGAFLLRLPPGPSREISAAFAGSETLTRAVGATLGLGVRSAVRLQASAAVARIGGAPLVFRGRVGAGSAEIPSGGLAVQLQFRLPGLPWSEFRTVRTDRGGRFRYAYRFSDDDSRGVRFWFRALAPAQSDWPYEAGASPPVAVRGR